MRTGKPANQLVLSQNKNIRQQGRHLIQQNPRTGRIRQRQANTRSTQKTTSLTTPRKKPLHITTTKLLMGILLHLLPIVTRLQDLRHSLYFLRRRRRHGTTPNRDLWNAAESRPHHRNPKLDITLFPLTKPTKLLTSLIASSPYCCRWCGLFRGSGG